MASLSQTKQPGRIDVHHHIFPSTLRKEALNVRIGWRTPAENLPWGPEKSLAAMDALGISTAILSYPAGFPPHPPGEENRACAHDMNSVARGICAKHPQRFGWFGCLGDWRDVEGALKELDHALDIMNADGVALSSSYGEGSECAYIADDRFDPIWEELNRRGAVVFIHGTQTSSSNPYPHEFLGIPIVEVPNETFKAAAHLVVTGKKRRFPRVRIILAHLGGSTPFLAPRVAMLSHHMGCSLTPEECMEDFATFYYETALTAHESTLGLIGRGRVLFGTDFPAVSTTTATWYTRNVDRYYQDDQQQLEEVMRITALELFPRLRATSSDVRTR